MKKTKSNVLAEVAINLTINQISNLEPILKVGREKGGLIVGGLVVRDSKVSAGFRLVPTQLGEKILQIVDEFYEQENLQEKIYDESKRKSKKLRCGSNRQRI